MPEVISFDEMPQKVPELPLRDTEIKYKIRKEINNCLKKKICSRCKQKVEDIGYWYVGLNCYPDTKRKLWEFYDEEYDDDDEMFFVTRSYNIHPLCWECQEELEYWLHNYK